MGVEGEIGYQKAKVKLFFYDNGGKFKVRKLKVTKMTRRNWSIMQ